MARKCSLSYCANILAFELQLHFMIVFALNHFETVKRRHRAQMLTFDKHQILT